MMLTKMYANCAAFLHSLKKDERGVTAIEYAIVAVTIAGVVATVFSGTAGSTNTLQGALTAAFTEITDKINSLIPAP